MQTAATACLEGNFDSVDSEHAWGWAWDRNQPDTSVSVDLVVDGVVVRTVIADAFGADLKLAGIGSGSYRWSFSVAEFLSDGLAHTIGVCFSGTSSLLAPGVRRIGGELLANVGDVDPKELLANIHLQGNGIEIGALYRPQQLPSRCTVRYVDRLSTQQLRTEYAELAAYDLVDVDIVDDGQTLRSFADESEDFIVANHFLEHCEDAIGTLINLFRVVRTGGHVLLTLPNKRGTSDAPRTPTTVDHFIADHLDGGAASRHEHVVDWVRHVEGLYESEHVALRIRDLERSPESIHFHVFTEIEMVELIAVAARQFDVPVQLLHLARKDDAEVVMVLQKLANSQSNRDNL
jgi:SAM-dependent methyltransferase